MNMHQFDDAELYALELSLWQTETRFDRSPMERTFAADFFEIGRSGRIWTREDCLSAVRHSITIELQLPDFAVRVISPGTVLVTYVSRTTTDGIQVTSLRASLWTKSEYGWRLRFHQGTPAAQE
jgi:hypothetical protein